MVNVDSLSVTGYRTPMYVYADVYVGDDPFTKRELTLDLGELDVIDSTFEDPEARDFFWDDKVVVQDGDLDGDHLHVTIGLTEYIKARIPYDTIV